MIRLIKVELTRLRWRRAVVVLLGAAVVVPVLLAVVTALDHAPPDGAGQARAERAAHREIARCVAHPRRYGLDKRSDVEQQCESFNPVENFLDYDALSLDREREQGSGIGMASVLGVIMFLVATTFVGHDWNTGSMSNQLLFESRRLRIWAAKAAAVTLGALVLAAIGAAAFWLVLAGRYLSGDAPLRGGVLVDCFQQGGRAAALAAVAALGGYALTMLSRSTVFTLGVLFGVSVAGGILINTVVDDPGWFDPTINASAVIGDGTTYYVQVPDRCNDTGSFQDDGSGSCNPQRERSLGQGVAYLAILLGAVGSASVVSFARRDVP